MKNEPQLDIKGTAIIDMSHFHEFRSSERQKAEKKEYCWPSALWQSYFYHHQDLYRYAKIGYDSCNRLNDSLKDSFDEQVENTCQYLETMGLEWDLLFQNDVITIVKYGNFAFGLPTEENIVECHLYTDLDDYTLNELRGRIGSGIHDEIAALVPNGAVSKKEVKSNIESMQNKINARQSEMKALEEQQRQEIERMKRKIQAKYKEQFD